MGLAVQLMEEARVRVLATGSALRFMTHRDLEAGDVDEALRRIEPLVERMLEGEATEPGRATAR